MPEIFQHSFMVRAFLAGAIIAISAPLLGNFLVIKRYSLIADTLSHIALAGVAIGLVTKTQPIVTTVILTIITAILIEKLRENKSLPGDAILAMFLPGGLAVSIILISLAGGLDSNLFSYLFGSITTVSQDELIIIFALGITTILTISILFKKLLFTSFDPDSAKVSGIPVGLLNTLLIVLTAVIVSLSMRIVGILLIGALTIIPVLTAMQVSRSFHQTVWFSVILGVVSFIGGLLIAFYGNLPAGGTIVLSSTGMFLITLISSRLFKI